MKLHPREKNVRAAETKLREVLLELLKDLTEGEYMRVIGTVMGDEINNTAKYMIREERHPGKPDEPGGIQ